MRALQELRFHWRDKLPPYSYVTSLSMGLQHHADADLLTGIYNVPTVGAAAALFWRKGREGLIGWLVGWFNYHCVHYRSPPPFAANPSISKSDRLTPKPNCPNSHQTIPPRKPNPPHAGL